MPASAPAQSWDDVLQGTASPLDSQQGQAQAQAPDWDAQLSTVHSPQDDLAPPSAPQDNSWKRWPKLAGQALVQGTDALLGMPGDVKSLVNSMGINPAVLPLPLQVGLGLPTPTSSDLMGATNKLGMTGRPEAQPQTPAEKYTTAGISAIPSIAATILSGGAALPSMIAGEGGALAGEAYHQFDPESKWGPVVVGTLVGLGVGGVSAFGNDVSKFRDAAKAVAQAKQGLQVAVDNAHYGNNALGATLDSTVVGSKTAFDKAKLGVLTAQQAHDEAANKFIGAIADTAGDSRTYQQAGTQLQASARNWLGKVLPGKLENAWKPVDAMVPDSTPVPLVVFNKALKDINTSAGALEPVAALFKPGAPARVAKIFEDLGAGPEGKAETPAKTGASKILDASGKPIVKEISPAQPAQPFTWGDVRKLRSTIGDAMGNPQAVKDIGQANLSHLYASITADLGDAASSRGAGEAFNQANAASKSLYQTAEGPMARVVASSRASAEDPKPESVAKGLLAGGKIGASDLGVLRAEIPHAVDELAAAHLHVNPSGWSGLAPEARDALVTDPHVQSFLDSTLAGKAKAKLDSGAAIAAAQLQHRATVGVAQDLADNAKFGNSTAVHEARKALAASKDHLANTPQPSLLSHSMTGVFGLGTGGEAGLALGNALGLPGSDLMHGALGGLIGGVAIPMVSNASRSMLNNPGNLRYLATGAAAGNPLSLGPSPGAGGQQGPR